MEQVKPVCNLSQIYSLTRECPCGIEYTNTCFRLGLFLIELVAFSFSTVLFADISGKVLLIL